MISKAGPRERRSSGEVEKETGGEREDAKKGKFGGEEVRGIARTDKRRVRGSQDLARAQEITICGRLGISWLPIQSNRYRCNLRLNRIFHRPFRISPLCNVTSEARIARWDESKWRVNPWLSPPSSNCEEGRKSRAAKEIDAGLLWPKITRLCQHIPHTSEKRLQWLMMMMNRFLTQCRKSRILRRVA